MTKECLYNLVCILGATASGKTTVAANLACKLESAVLSADSRQVYRRMDIGTGKDLSDYVVNGTKVPYELIDIVEAGTKFNLFDYQQAFMNVFQKYQKQGKIPVLCGGSGLYIESALKSYQLQSVPINNELREKLEAKPFEELVSIFTSYRTPHNKSDFDTKKRLIRAIEIEDFQQNNTLEIRKYPEVNSLIIGIHFEREEQKKRITERLHARLREGMIEEVKSLLDGGIKAEDLLYYGLEYKFITQYIRGELNYDQLVNLLNIAIHQFSKRQMTWFRKMEREGLKVHWIEGFLPTEEKIETILALLKKNGS